MAREVFSPLNGGLPAAVLALLPDAVGVFAALRDANGTIVDFEWRLANPAAETLMGRSDLTGQRLSGSGAEQRCPGLSAALVEGMEAAVVRTLGRTGGGRWRLSASPFPGGVCATLAASDPADSSAETLASALEHGAESFALFDSADRLVHATGRLKDLLPGMAGQLVPGLPFEALVRRTAEADGSLTDEAGRARWIDARLAHHRRADHPFTVRSPDGRWLLVSEHGLPDGGVLVIYADVTSMKHNEESLRAREAEARAARHEAERANRAKSDFLAQMSHELRTPLNAVLGFSELLTSEAFGPLGNPRYRTYAADIRDSGAHLLSLINDILDLSRIEAGRMTLADEHVDVAAQARRAMVMLRDRAERKGVVLTSDIAGDLPLLLGDPRAVRQMLVNLLGNAVKFTPPGGRAVLTASPTPDGGIGVMVADTGCGIPAIDLARVLEPFERVETSLDRTTEGTGLGLPIVKRLIELHGGRLDLSSEPGAGTSAVLTFPPSRSLPCVPPCGPAQPGGALPGGASLVEER